MKNRRTIGCVLMIIALVIPLYMFGSMSIDILNEQNKYNEYLEEVSKKDFYKSGVMKRALEYNSHLGDNSMPVDPFESDDYNVEYKITDDPDAKFAYLTIPSIEVSEPIYLGATVDHLSWGFGHVDGTALPIGEKNTRSVIAGHRRTWKKLFLYYADELKEGDVLNLYIAGKTLQYKMISREIISPEEWEQLLPINGKEIITVLTCTPIPTYENRMLLNFERIVKEEKPSAELESTLGTQEVESSGEAVESVDVEVSSISNKKYILFGISILLILAILYLVFILFKGKKKE